jgi:tRNA threonylcarbamoyladenosine modification (KEOPS) complex  Pcc1 subunit
MSGAKHTATLFLGSEEGRFLCSALGPETGELRRCSVRWSEAGDGYRLIIEAEDLHSLRAALNSYMRWANVALSVFRKFGTR